MNVIYDLYDSTAKTKICGYNTCFAKKVAAVSCSPGVYRLPAAGLGIWLMGQLGCAWVGAWVHGSGDDDDDVVGVGRMHVYTTWIGEVGYTYKIEV